MQDLNKALAEIEDIRINLAASSVFRGFGPKSLAITGLLAGALGAIQHFFPPSSLTSYLHSWILLAVLCTVIVGIDMVLRCKRIHHSLADAMLIGALEQLVPALACGVLFSIFCFYGSSQTLWMLPGVWQILMGLGLFAAVRKLVPGVKLVAVFYLMAGFTVLTLSLQQTQPSPWLMALPFLVGQSALSIVFQLSKQNDDEDN